VTQETYTYDSGLTFLDILNRGSNLPASYENVISETTYDYGSGQAESVLKRTSTTFQFLWSKSQERIFDGA
jgi:hypothetical protein